MIIRVLFLNRHHIKAPYKHAQTGITEKKIAVYMHEAPGKCIPGTLTELRK
jgi:hypothetical protein